MDSIFVILTTLGLLFSMLLFIIPNLSHGFASLIPFERQEISDEENQEWIFWKPTEKKYEIPSMDGDMISVPAANSESQCNYLKPISPSIRSVSYMSDGQTLSSTIWMSSNLLESQLLSNSISKNNLNTSNASFPLWHRTRAFTMVIDDVSTFDQGIDYRMELFASSDNQWKRQLNEVSKDGTSKLISNESFTNFPYDGKKFIEFSVNARSISEPRNYRILFYVTDLYVKDGRLCRMVDSTNWIISPPPSFNVVFSPNSVFMRPGEDKDIILTISGSSDLQAKVRLNTINASQDLPKIKLLSNETIISAFSNGSSVLRIDIPDIELKESRHYTIPIIANISFPTVITQRNGFTFYNNKSIGLSKYGSLVLTVLPSLTWDEKIDQFAQTLRPIGDLWQIFAAIGTVVVSATLFLYKRKSRDNKNKNNKDIDRQNK